MPSLSHVSANFKIPNGFYKQSVNVREGIRPGIRTLPRAEQESYTESVAGTYRSLADLLLKQDRILEA